MKYVLYDLTTHVVCSTIDSEEEPVASEGYDYLVVEELPENFSSKFVQDGVLCDIVENTVRDLATEKARLLERFEQSRLLRMNAPCQTPFGVVDADLNSRANIAGACNRALAAMATNGQFSIVWRMADNTDVELTAAQMVELASAVESRVSIIHADTVEKKTLVNVCSTLEELDILLNMG